MKVNQSREEYDASKEYYRLLPLVESLGLNKASVERSQSIYASYLKKRDALVSLLVGESHRLKMENKRANKKIKQLQRQVEELKQLPLPLFTARGGSEL